ncbi:MAG: pentapeptide repeat-containing protein [Opitutaceae bacterium]|nr:pentapeptide repeat-containing protein [Opitutaceae bacterium]
MKKIITIMMIFAIIDMNNIFADNNAIDSDVVGTPIINEVALSKKDFINMFGPTGICLKCDLSNLDLRATVIGLKDNFYEINLEGSNLSLSDLSPINNLSSSIIINVNLAASNLKYVNFKYSNLSGANLAGADLTGVDLTGANLSGANLTGAILKNAILTGADLTGANLTFADLTETTLYQANFTSANLTNAIFNKSKLKTTVFTNANTTGTSFGRSITEQNREEAINLSILSSAE